MGIGDWAQSPIPNPHFSYLYAFKYKNKNRVLNNIIKYKYY